MSLQPADAGPGNSTGERRPGARRIWKGAAAKVHAPPRPTQSHGHQGWPGGTHQSSGSHQHHWSPGEPAGKRDGDGGLARRGLPQQAYRLRHAFQPAEEEPGAGRHAAAGARRSHFWRHSGVRGTTPKYPAQSVGP